VNDKEDAGVHTVSFDGSGLAAGIYYYRLQAGLHNDTKAFVLVK
jgi:hypothetical protein